MRHKKESACKWCDGAGFIAELYPKGHTEDRCEACDGKGYFEEMEELGTDCTCEVMSNSELFRDQHVETCAIWRLSEERP